MLVIASHLDDSRVVVALGYNFDVFCANTDAAPAVDETFGTDEATESYGLDNLDQAIPVPLAIPVRLFAAVARAELVKDPSLDRKALMAWRAEHNRVAAQLELEKTEAKRQMKLKDERIKQLDQTCRRPLLG